MISGASAIKMEYLVLLVITFTSIDLTVLWVVMKMYRFRRGYDRVAVNVAGRALQREVGYRFSCRVSSE